MESIVTNYHEKVKRKVNKLCPDSGKVEKRFLGEMLIGISGSKDIKLSNIGRSLKLNQKIIYTEKRLSRNIEKYDFVDRINSTMIQERIRELTGEEIIAIDTTDIQKKYGKKMEEIGKIYDGSEKEVGQGYEVLIGGIIIREKKLPLYCETYSSKGKTKRIDVLIKLLDQLNEKKMESPIGTIVMDRGFSARWIYNYMQNNDLNFIIREKTSRKIKIKGQEKEVYEIYDYMNKKQFLSDVIHDEKIKQTKIRIGFSQIEIEGVKEKLTMIAIKSKLYRDPMYLVTNRKCRNSESAKLIYEMYLKRWGIETLIRVLKEEYNIEDVRIMRFKGLRNIISIAVMVLYIVGKIVYSIGNNTFFMKNKLLLIGKRVKQKGTFLYHAVCKGLYTILIKTDKIFEFCPKLKQDFQIKLFPIKFG